MFMTRTTITAIAYILVSAAIALLLVLPGSVEARTPRPVLKGDRLDLRPLGPACSERAWPYYEDTCLRDRTQPRSQARQIRVVSADRSWN